jgi:hypothetical protein
MKPLYLRGADIRVVMDGPALKVSKPGQTDGWFPLRRVSTVVSAIRVDWSSEALLACAAAGVAVSFLEDSGRVMARLLGHSSERDELRQRLNDFMLKADWRDDYTLWRAGMEQRAVRSVARRFDWPASEIPTARAVRQAVHDAARTRGLLEAFDAIGQEVLGLLTALATQQLSDAGLGVDYEGWTELDLAADLSGILFWDFHPARLAWLNMRQARGEALPPARGEIVAFFEARRARSENLLRGLLSRLHHWLLQQYRWR